MTKFRFFAIFPAAAAVLAAVIMVFSCGKSLPPGPANPQEETVDETETVIIIPSEQGKFYLSAEEDLKGKVTEKTAAIKVLLTDSKYFAVGEKVLSVSFTADNPVIPTGNTVTMTWRSEDALHRPEVGHMPDAGEYGILCLPGTFNGIFTVVTSRYTYEFTKSVTAPAGSAATVSLDFAYPDKQPVRKVGIFGDSISTFAGELPHDEYRWFYPDKDPNYGSSDPAKAAKAVDCKEKTWWWKVIYEYMSSGEADVINSWGSSKLIHSLGPDRFEKKVYSGFIDRMYEFKDPDIIFIHGGTNDHNQSTPMGEYTWDATIGQGNTVLFRSAYIELVKALQNRYEGVQLIIIIGDRLSQPYEEAALTVAEHFGLPVVNFVGDDIEKCSGSHPSAAGFQVMAEKIYNSCKDYLP